MLTIDQGIHDAIVAHARRDHPDEACGVVAGPAGSDRPTRHLPMLNAAMSPTFYEFDATDLLRLYQDMDARDEELVIIYHSHTATPAYPSRTDIALAQEPGAHYVLVSTRDRDNDDEPEFRSYRIIDGQVEEEDVRVVPSLETAAE
ncbi:MAG: M67 family metallopeptidase [Nocardioidaceae bacterium]|nr:M67 family metallopeptidase [Nocardioidaceae bacterium]